MEMTPYGMCINNAARYIVKNPPELSTSIDAFIFSSVLSVCFCKDKAEIIVDIIEAAKSIERKD